MRANDFLTIRDIGGGERQSPRTPARDITARPARFARFARSLEGSTLALIPLEFMR